MAINITDEQICKANDRIIEYGRLKKLAQYSCNGAFLRGNIKVSDDWEHIADLYHEAQVACILTLRDLGIEVATDNVDPRVRPLVPEGEGEDGS
jgi:hypothetical protein